MNRKFRWKRDLPDVRDAMFTSGKLGEGVKLMPSRIDLRLSFPPPYDQGELGSCTAQSVGALCDYKYGSEVPFLPSTLFLYYCTRKIEHTEKVDAGASIRDTIKAVNKYGICEAKEWPYDEQMFALRPSPNAYANALEHQALEYRRLRQNLDELRAALAEDCPVAFGFSVYESFYQITAENYCIKHPGPNEEMLGGHAVAIVGYDDDLQVFIIRNSWGEDWGNNGYFLMDYSFALNPKLCADFWTIKLMEKRRETI